MILCCGEALVDMIPSQDAAGHASFTPHAGGAVFNTAIALGRLGRPTGFLSGLSDDLFGKLLKDALTASGVDAGMAITSARPTTLAFVQLTDGHASYTFYDENTAGRQLETSQLPELNPETHALYFGGISLIHEPCAEFYAALSLRESARRVVMIDPNIRAGFVQDETRYRARLDRMIAVADIVKVSDEDLHWLVAGPQDLAEKVAAIRARGPQIVIVTKGGAGAAALAPSGRMIEVAAPKVTVADTVGAGDTFNAGVLARLSEKGLLNKPAIATLGDDVIRDALEFGVRVAAITVSRSGANPPWAHEMTGPGATG